MNKETSKQISIKGAHYLACQVNDKGKFIYFRDKTGAPVLGEYNLLRHCGCIWAMSQVYNCFPNPLLEKAISRACNYLLLKSVINPNKGLFLVNKGITKLGGNALAYLAIHEQKVYHPFIGSIEFYLEGYEKGIGNFILYRNKISEILSKISINSFESVQGFDSEYYPGEAVLALSYSDSFKVGYDICKYLSKTRDKIKPIQDHWLLQGIEVLLTKITNIRSQQFLKQYAERICHEILSDRSYRDRSVRMACRSEALISYYHIFPRKKKAFILLNELLDLQAKYQVKDTPSELEGAFVESDGTRIDYVQHNVSSFIRFYKM